MRRAQIKLIDCGLCWYGVHKESDTGVLNEALVILEGFGNILSFPFLFLHEKKFNFLVMIVACGLDVVITEDIYVFHRHILSS